MNNPRSCFAHLVGIILLLVGFCILPLYIQDRHGYHSQSWDRRRFLNVRWEADDFVVLSVVLMTGGPSLLAVGRNARRQASRNDESEEE